MNLFSLEKKHIVITGASSGIGKQCAIACSKMGANVALIGRNNVNLKSTLSSMIGDNHTIITADITQIDGITDIINKSVNKLGKIDGFIHAAGMEKTLPFKMQKKEVFQEIMTINVFAGFELARVISLKKNSNAVSCSLIFISSVMGTVGQAGQVAYCASKGALVAGAKALAVEMAKRNIRVNCVSPGQVKDTQMTTKMVKVYSEEALTENERAHLLGWVSVEDIASACIYLLSSASEKITGTNLLVDGGYCAK